MLLMWLKMKVWDTEHQSLCKWNKRRDQSFQFNLACVRRHAYLFSGEDVSCQFDLGEVAFANGFKQPIVTNVWLVIWCGRGDGVPTSRHAGAAGWLGLLRREEAICTCMSNDDSSIERHEKWKMSRSEYKARFQQNCANSITGDLDWKF